MIHYKNNTYFGTRAVMWTKRWRRGATVIRDSVISAKFSSREEDMAEVTLWRVTPAHTCFVRCRSMCRSFLEINSCKSHGVYRDRRSCTAPYCELNPRPSETGYRQPSYWIGTRGKFYSHHRNIPANLVDTMFSGRTASRAVYPGTPWWLHLYDAPYSWGFITLHNIQLHLPECTIANWRLKDAFEMICVFEHRPAFECSLMGKGRWNLDSSVGSNWEGKKCKTETAMWKEY